MLKMNTEKFLSVLVVNFYLDMPLMDENKIEELLVLTRDNNKMLKDIWNILNNQNNEFKDFLINVIANQIGGRR